MARATRSTTTHEKDKTQDHPQTSRKGASKKRKRNSNAENEESPVTKHLRTDTKEEGSPELEDHLEDRKEVELPSSGDVPLQDADAANILEVLEMVDTQGLLDRVFPLSTDSVEGASPGSSSTSSATMFSLRALLKSPSQYPLRILHAAIKHLHPISSHPRFRPSETTVQQLRFCDLATSLLDQASRHNAPVPPSAESIIADTEADENATSPSSTHESSLGVRPRKYALVQHLPTGDWWSSTSSEVLTADGKGRDLKTLHAAKAELVSIFPAPSGQALAHKGTLGDYAAKKRPNPASYRPPQPRRVSCGKFLDYGPYASFAPYFDQDGVEVGRIGMGEVIFYQEMKRRLRSLVKGKRRAFLAAGDAVTEDVVMEEASSSGDAAEAGPSHTDDTITDGLESLLSPEEVRSIKTALGSLEMEQAVDELLQKNGKALQRLEELQLLRLRAQGGGSSAVEVGSEEWDVAQGITDSLALLASLRPRPSNGDPDDAPLVPPASVLHKLQRTLPLAATEGWYGTLPEGRATAFHDDTTVHVRATSATPVKPVPVPTAPAPKATTPAPAYNPYSYANTYQSSQYRSAYGTYTPTQGSYYPSSTTYPTTTTTQTTTAAHYPNAAQYGTAHSQYYSGWYGNSGRSTPQPATGQSGLSGNFASYFAPGTAQQPQPQRAVANTVLSSAKQPYQQPTWNGTTTQGGYTAPTLPPHMRTTAGGTTTPGTPPPATPTGTYGYYGGYTAPR
ncbi:hypothetical protein K466DRAFT_512391 [Polyporus arcularius HHB13444]|uniref:Uncharacterized protein n=1 Tax=Polyporus arcularius HHB13444 TaxID=1314778 RepID=A0A5C3PWE5_9APHY|nr:hypothetical protein K466DRAFT_512391 [Polyporus arcularius HHB13444]